MNRPTRAQLAMIHIAAKDLGLDEATYRAVLKEQTGKASASEISYGQASAVIDLFESKGWRPKRPGKDGGAGLRPSREKAKASSEARLKRSAPKAKRSSSGRRRQFEDLGDRPGMASPGQLRMIEALWAEIAVGDPGATLRKFLMRRWRSSDLRFLTSRQAWEVIEAVKAMIRRRTGEGG